jgi:hypothetical protein
MRAFSFPVEIDTVLDGFGEKQADLIKEAVIEKAQREGLLKSLDPPLPSESQALSIGDRLSQRERVLLNGPADLSARSVRKQIVHKTVDEVPPVSLRIRNPIQKFSN